MDRTRILLIDDEGIFLMAHREELETAGYEVCTALRGKEAVAIAEKERFDIVFVDLVMPEMNGVAVCREIKKLDPDTEVVLVSGYPYELHKYMLDFLNAGGRDEQLTKPLLEDEMVCVVKRILAEREGHQKIRKSVGSGPEEQGTRW